MEMHTPQSLHRIHGISLPHRPGRQQSLIGRLFSKLMVLRSAIEAEVRARRAAAELASLDDYMLRDIGVPRGDIERIARGGRDISAYREEPTTSTYRENPVAGRLPGTARQAN
jgi:uncharacterized protein YjiS (DUF1127 family)